MARSSASSRGIPAMAKIAGTNDTTQDLLGSAGGGKESGEVEIPRHISMFPFSPKSRLIFKNTDLEATCGILGECLFKVREILLRFCPCRVGESKCGSRPMTAACLSISVRLSHFDALPAISDSHRVCGKADSFEIGKVKLPPVQQPSAFEVFKRKTTLATRLCSRQWVKERSIIESMLCVSMSESPGVSPSSDDTYGLRMASWRRQAQ